MADKLVKAQVISGCAIGQLTLTAAETIDVTGGFFVNIKTTTGTADHTVAADTVISGYLDVGAQVDDANIVSNVLTVPASPGVKYTFDFYPVGVVVRMPVTSGQTVVASMGGLLCDLDITTSKQTVDTGSTSTEVVQILPVSNEDIASNTVRVIMNPAKVGR